MKRNLATNSQIAPPPSVAVQPKGYEPTPQERLAAVRVLKRSRDKPPAPKLTVQYDPVDPTSVTIGADHVEPAMARVLLADTLATGDLNFADGILDQVANVARTGKRLKPSELNFALAAIRGIGPRDETEALLAAQMIAVHGAVMDAAHRLRHGENIAQKDSAASMLAKLGRVFTSQVEALTKYRSGGEQIIKVQYVTVAEGGQAIIGNVQTGGGGPRETGGQPHGLGTTSPSGQPDASSPALHGNQQAIAKPLPGASGEGLECVPGSRRARRRTKGKA